MKKLIITLSALTIPTTIVPTIVSCGKEKGLNLNSLTADSFKQLEFFHDISFETANINEINDDKALIKDIKDHIKIMTLKKVFDLSSIIIVWSKADRNRLDAYNFFWDSATPPILDINVTVLEPNKKYEITIKKAKWDNVKIINHTDSDKNVSNIVKPYYDLIKGEQVKIVIDK